MTERDRTSTRTRLHVRLQHSRLKDQQVGRYIEGKTVRKVVIAGGAARLVSIVVS